MGYSKKTKITYIIHIEHFRGTPGKVKQRIKNIAEQDGKECMVGIEGDPGQAGKVEAKSYVSDMPRFNVRTNFVKENKATRAKPLSAQAEAGKEHLLSGNKWY